MSIEWLFSAIVFASLGIVVIVVVVGGIVCVKDNQYDFSEYLIDLSSMWKVLGSALVGTFGRALVPALARWGSSK